MSVTSNMIGDALVMPDAPEVLLGAIPLEHMDLTINPQAEAEGFSRELVGVHGDKEMHRVYPPNQPHDLPLPAIFLLFSMV